MRANRGRDTAPELLLRSALHARGLRFRKDFPVRLPTVRARPDIAFPGVKLAVFVDGCFWHGCPQHGEIPVGNRDFWEAKISANKERDGRQTEALHSAGWTVIRVWEHEPVPPAVRNIESVVRSLRDN
jgi:DNA mismatch endonuclease (patch repair protein)